MNTVDLLPAVLGIAEEAGRRIMQVRESSDFGITAKADSSPLTLADMAAHHHIVAELKALTPLIPLLSEEDADISYATRRAWTHYWLVDPLDGTKEFIKGIPEFVVAIALAERGVPVMGVSYNPIKDELFWGVRGAGCHLNDKIVTVSEIAALEHSTILASRSETARGEWKAYEGRVTVRPIGSVAYKLALVAAGQADATFTLTPKSEWDIASGVALIIAAGGRVTDLYGAPIEFNRRDVKTPGFVASNGHLHAQLERMLPHRNQA
jgi:myo-inositol-1(or 4)-monophosphatase